MLSAPAGPHNLSHCHLWVLTFVKNWANIKAVEVELGGSIREDSNELYVRAELLPVQPQLVVAVFHVASGMWACV